MSASQNADAMAGKGGEFSSRRPGDEPMQTGGHQPGKLVGNDAVPEFEAKTLPAGSAPASKTFQPNVDPPVMDRSQIDPEGNLAAQELGGTDSAAVHQSMGAPGSGQTSAELHDKSKSGQSIEGVGKQSVLQSSVDTKDPKMAQHRNLADDNAAPGQRGTVGGASAEDRVPVSSEQVAGERK